ncbi:4674_t:CDS:2 [Entrophospora sp. SA101]|nr:4674_t:CDS:2 [Entrophospora sp. SA101]
MAVVEEFHILSRELLHRQPTTTRLLHCDKPKKSKVYTRTGDKGTSSLYNGERRSKDDPIFDALGTIDELNSSIGIANFYCKKAGNSLIENLIEIQCNLIQVMSNVATPRSNSNDSKIS